MFTARRPLGGQTRAWELEAMTVTADVTPQVECLRDLTDTQLWDLWAGTSDPVTLAAVTRDMDRRDREDRLARTRAKLADVYAEGERQAYAQYREAERVCRGELLSRAGKAAARPRRVRRRVRAVADAAGQSRRFTPAWELGDYWRDHAARITARDVRPAAGSRQARRIRAGTGQQGGSQWTRPPAGTG